jgi:hypothetical protein
MTGREGEENHVAIPIVTYTSTFMCHPVGKKEDFVLILTRIRWIKFIAVVW